MIELCLVDDEKLFLDGLMELLQREPDFEVSNHFSTSKSFIQAWESMTEKPDIVLMDMNIPEIDGTRLTNFVLNNSPKVKVIALSSHYTKSLVFKMLQLGASSYVSKNTDTDKLCQTIRKVQENGFYFDEFRLIGLQSNELTKKEKKDLLYHGLTDRELEVLKLICEQNTTNEISERLFISKKTVERHRTRIFAKTGVDNIVGLVLFALKHSLVEKEFVE